MAPMLVWDTLVLGVTGAAPPGGTWLFCESNQTGQPCTGLLTNPPAKPNAISFNMESWMLGAQVAW